MEQKQLLIMRQYGIGVSEGAEASGYAKFEAMVRTWRVTFAAKGLPVLSGKYICAVLQGSSVTPCGELPVSGGNGMARFDLSMPLRPGGVLAAAVLYTEGDLAYPVLLGHKGGGSAWQEEVISGTCKALGIRRANLFRSAAAEAPQTQPAPQPAPPAAPEPEEPAAPEKTPETEPSYYAQNRAHFENLLRRNQPLKELNELVPGSEWVLVHQNKQAGGPYVFGLIRDEAGEPLFLCYGVGGTADQKPPRTLSGYCQWIPRSLREQEEGYWVIYQSARDGKTYQEEETL